MNKIQKSNTKSEELIVFFENILEIITRKRKKKKQEHMKKFRENF